MRFNAVPGSTLRGNRFRSVLYLFALACGAALITVGPGCGSSGSSLPADAGSGGGGGKIGAGGSSAGGSGAGGSSAGGSGMGGSSMGGSGAGGSGMGGAVDSGIDRGVLCIGAMYDGGEIDTDGDGFVDCQDGCPMDNSKIAPGVCGCGVSDQDSDADGVPDCVDKCPGTPDVDTDNDGVLDCKDACPLDPAHTTAGVCGCGVPENTPLCLIHRYSFNDTTSTIADSITITGVSPKNGTGSTTTLIPAGGKLTLAGGASNVIGGQFVTLPAGTISTIGNNATFEVWFTWSNTSQAPWQRVFDFGNSDMPAGMPGNNGQTYLFVTPLNSVNQDLRAAISLNGGGASEDVVNGPGSLPGGATAPEFHLAVVVDDAHLTMTMYLNGVVTGTPATLRGHGILSAIKDVNNWLGRSQYLNDPLFGGSYDEFRIYSSALSGAQIAANFAAGPNIVPAAVTPDAGTPTDGGTDVPANPDAGTDAAVGQ